MKQLISTVLLLVAMCSFYGCNSNPSKTKEMRVLLKNKSLKKYWVKNTGSRLNILDKGDLSATISLEQLKNIPNLCAIGPIEGLKGEITIYNGEVSIATIENGKPKFTSNIDSINAIFLVYGESTKWRPIKIDKPLVGNDQIEAFVSQKLAENGLHKEKSFPFRIEGSAEVLDYHIIYKNDNVLHNKVEHKKAKQKFKISHQEVKIMGFWADAHGENIYTHKGYRTHLHFIQKDKNVSGHVDNIKLNQGAILYLPESN